MDFSRTFAQYEQLVAQVDKIFAELTDKNPDCVQCKLHCADCCHAVFDVTLVEAVYINRRFNDSLDRMTRREVLRRADKADREAYRIKRRVQKMYVKEGKTPEEVFLHLGQERVRCPLLNDKDLCDLYGARPVTCRVYGIPTSFGGKAHICEQARFEAGAAYPTINLDTVIDRLLTLSEALVEEIGQQARAGSDKSLVPVSTALMTSYDEEFFGIGAKR